MLHSVSVTVRFIVGHPLSRGRTVRNLSRYVGWQLRSKIAPRPRVFRFANEARMYVAPRLTGITGSYYVGLHDFEEMAFLPHLLRPGDLFVDVGANVGSYTVLAASVSGADVIAFEPGEAVDWLRRNIELNGLSERVVVRREAVGATVGVAAFTSGLDVLNRLDAAGDNTVNLTTLDAACPRPPAAIKIDVEGFESQVLQGGSDTLANPELLAIVCEEMGPIASAMLADAGFQRYRYEPFARRLVPAERDTSLLNGIFVRDRERAEERLRSAPAFLVDGRGI